VINVGGFAGFFASVLAMGVTQPPGMNVSAELTVLGGAAGSFLSFGGATKPSSLDPSPAKAVPTHNVKIKISLIMYYYTLWN
tara:strand:- start:19374 stop:19619 length:246 start_codon:yes stop_codon:yes gene_type:complete